MIALFLKAFGITFLAEMGDKTQLTTLGLAASAGAGVRHPALAIFLGAALALVCTSAIAALFGGWISAHVPAKAVKSAAGVMFLAFGVACLVEAAR